MWLLRVVDASQIFEGAGGAFSRIYNPLIEERPGCVHHRSTINQFFDDLNWKFTTYGLDAKVLENVLEKHFEHKHFEHVNTMLFFDDNFNNTVLALHNLGNNTSTQQQQKSNIDSSRDVMRQEIERKVKLFVILSFIGISCTCNHHVWKKVNVSYCKWNNLQVAQMSWLLRN